MEWTALHQAALKGHDKVITILLRHGADINALATEYGITPLHQSALTGHHQAAKVLLQSGANPNIANIGDGYTPLLVAAERGHILAVEVLISGGADVRAKAKMEWTALHQAAVKGHGEVVARLLEHDVDINAQAGRVGQTPLYNAAFKGHDHIIKLLLDKGADPRKRTTQKKTAADIAAQFGHKSCEKLLPQ
jgi:ankyrin repeat protein